MVEDNEKIIEMLIKNEISLDIGFINFTPYSDLKGLNANLSFLSKYKFLTGLKRVLNKIIPYNGKILHKKIKRDKLLKSEYTLEYWFTDNKIEQLYDHLKMSFTEVNHNKEEFKIMNEISVYFSFLNNYYAYIKRKVSMDQENNHISLVLNQFEDRYKHL